MNSASLFTFHWLCDGERRVAREAFVNKERTVIIFCRLAMDPEKPVVARVQHLRDRSVSDNAPIVDYPNEHLLIAVFWHACRYGPARVVGDHRKVLGSKRVPVDFDLQSSERRILFAHSRCCMNLQPTALVFTGANCEQDDCRCDSRKPTTVVDCCLHFIVLRICCLSPDILDPRRTDVIGSRRLRRELRSRLVQLAQFARTDDRDWSIVYDSRLRVGEVSLQA